MVVCLINTLIVPNYSSTKG